MDFQTLLDPEIQKFITAHEKDDVAQLALKSLPDQNWPRAAIMDQIKSRQKARIKIPQWFETDSTLILPAPDLIEQASSAATSLYKAGLFAGESFVDLTGGLGVDTWALSRSFKTGTCIETNEHAAALLGHNLPKTCNCPIDVINTDAESFVPTMSNVDLVFIDPQRRDDKAKGKFRFEDCSPDILGILPTVTNKAKKIVIKASPMIDINQAVQTLECVTHIHVLEKDQNCKEVLFVLEPQASNENPQITAAALDEAGKPLSTLTFAIEDEHNADCNIAMPQTYLYEPNPAFLKTGGFKILAQKYGLAKLHQHTHLYTSDKLKTGFPGRIFEISGIHKAQASDIPEKKGNLAVRNFPMPVEKLKKKLKIADGGELYFFACTLADDKKIILSARKA